MPYKSCAITTVTTLKSSTMRRIGRNYPAIPHIAGLTPDGIVGDGSGSFPVRIAQPQVAVTMTPTVAVSAYYISSADFIDKK